MCDPSDKVIEQVRKDMGLGPAQQAIYAGAAKARTTLEDNPAPTWSLKERSKILCIGHIYINGKHTVVEVYADKVRVGCYEVPRGFVQAICDVWREQSIAGITADSEVLRTMSGPPTKG